MLENKHYIRLDSENYVVYAFSDAFEQPQQKDICFEEHGGRQLVINGITNPPVTNMYGLPIYKYDNGVILSQEKPLTPEQLVISNENKYGALVVSLIRKRYTSDDEFDLHNSVTDALATDAAELPADYIVYREYVETCKDIAYMEVYGIERT